MAQVKDEQGQILSGEGNLVVGFGLATTSELSDGQIVPAEGERGLKVDSWLTIDKNGMVIIYSGKVELGTGVQTALTQIVVEELYITFDQVHYVQGDTSRTPNERYTAGSKTIQTQGPKLRQAAATAFQVLLELASQRLGVPASELRAKDGKIGIGKRMDRAITYGELIGEQVIQLPSNPDVPAKDPSAYDVVGQPVPRLDLPAKFTAQFTYVSDLVVPNMLHGRVIRPAGRNATFMSINPASLEEVRNIPGFRQVVQEGNFVGVVATTEWAAIRAAQRLQVNWDHGPSLADQASLAETLQDPANIYGTLVEKDEGDVDTALANAAQQLQATYFTPFQMHGSVGPSCAVADVRGAPDETGIQVVVWSATQGVYPLQGAIAHLLDLPASAVHVIYMEAAGCYGHNGVDDAAADAVLLSRAVGQPVRVQWMRQDEHGWEPLSPAMLHKMKGGLDAKGNLIAWEHTVYTPPHTTRPSGNAANLLAGQAVGFLPMLPPARRNAGTRNGPVTYQLDNDRYTGHHVKTFATVPGSLEAAAPLTYTLLRPSALRSLGGFSNTFANESFMDEMAVVAGVDPLDFRLRYLTDGRAIAVLEAMAKKAHWKRQLPPGPPGMRRGRGIAFLQYETQEAYVVAYAEVQVSSFTGAVQVTRVVVAHDCGLIINPDGLRNQIEGNVIQGISRTLKEEVAFDRNGVTNRLWSEGPDSVIHFNEVPPIEIVLIDHPTKDAWGAGEPAIGAMPAAIGNAIFNATGARLRRLPFTRERVLAALSGG